MRGKKVLLSMCLFSVGAQLMAQRHAGAEELFRGMTECASTIGGWRCLELDLSAELTEENDTTKSYQYSWNFGDGHRQPGHKIEHCYEDFGSYQISMDLIDTEADVVIRNELSATLDLSPEALAFTLFFATVYRRISPSPSKSKLCWVMDITDFSMKG